jgi:hypothetical protein
MILLIANEDDIETIEVCRWLSFYNEVYQVENSIFGIFTYDYSKIKSVWNRGYILDLNKLPLSDSFFSSHQIERFCLKELELGLTSVYYSQKNTKQLGNILYLDVNKLKVLQLANEIGLLIPKTYTISQKNILSFLLKKHEFVISKPFSNIESFYSKGKEEIIIPYTQIFSREDLNNVPESFFPSLVQEYISPLFEIKGLFFNKKLYCVSIKSQNGESYTDSKILLSDSMNSEIAKCKLPMNISQKVIKLFKSLNLNIGTFDFIVNEKNEYYFLEINPSGRFSKIVDEVDSDIYMDIANYLR